MLVLLYARSEILRIEATRDALFGVHKFEGQETSNRIHG